MARKFPARHASAHPDIMGLRPKGNHTKQPGQRRQRVGEEVKQALSMLFTRGDFANADLSHWLVSHSITITQVLLSPDLKHAKVYVVPLGGVLSELGEEIENLNVNESDVHSTISKEMIKLLNESASELRFLLGKQLALRFIPSLKFYRDDTFEQAERIESLIRKVRSTESDEEL